MLLTDSIFIILYDTFFCYSSGRDGTFKVWDIETSSSSPKTAVSASYTGSHHFCNTAVDRSRSSGINTIPAQCCIPLYTIAAAFVDAIERQLLLRVCALVYGAMICYVLRR
jgi:hypothetical protein